VLKSIGVDFNDLNKLQFAVFKYFFIDAEYNCYVFNSAQMKNGKKET